MGWMFFLFVMLVVFPIALVKIVIDNAAAIMLTTVFVLAIVILLIIGLVKKPGITLIVLALCPILLFVMDLAETNNSTVTVYAAIDTSKITDSDGNQYEIPLGAVVAHHSSTYSWYYGDQSNSIDVDRITNYSELTEVGQIKYKEYYTKSKWWKKYVSEAQDLALAAEAERQALAEQWSAFDDHPFEQKYWVIFTEGSRDNRLELSTIDSPLSRDDLHIVWMGRLGLNDPVGQSECTQYFLDENGQWVQIGTYHRLSDDATEIIASNLDVYDRFGNLILEKVSYSDLDLSSISCG